MLTIHGKSRLFIYVEPINMKISFEGLSAMVEMLFPNELTSGAFFVFFNKSRDRIKILYWDLDGFVIWYKRLEKGCFSFKGICNGLIDRKTFLMLLEGVTPRRLQKRFAM